MARADQFLDADGEQRDSIFVAFDFLGTPTITAGLPFAFLIRKAAGWETANFFSRARAAIGPTAPRNPTFLAFVAASAKPRGADKIQVFSTRSSTY